MAIRAHSAEYNIKAGVVGGVGYGSDLGILVDGDLTTLAAAKAAVDVDAAKLHVAERTAGIRVKAALDRADDYLADATTGSSVANITNLLPGVHGRHLRF